jgi:hypothetical protein
MGLSAQEILKTDPEFVQRQLQAQEMQRLNPSGSAAGAIGAVLGRGLGNVSRGQGFFETNNPGLQRVADVNNIMKSVQFDPKNPATYYEQVGTALQEAGYADLAPMAFQEARKFAPKDKFVTGKPGEKIYRQTSTGELEEVASIPDRESIVKTPANFAAAAGELGFGVLPNLSDYTPAQTAAVNNLLQTRGERTQAAGVPQSGEVKIQDLASARGLVKDLTGSSKDKLDTVRDVRTQLNLAKKGEGAALPQLQRQLIKLVGDSQIAQSEVRTALGSAGIVGDTINAVNQFMTGVPTADKLASVEKVIDALEDINAQSYNRSRKQAAEIIGEARFNEQTKKALIPPEYKTRKEKSTGFVEGKVYRDASGNRARYVNGKWEPVQ